VNESQVIYVGPKNVIMSDVLNSISIMSKLLRFAERRACLFNCCEPTRYNECSQCLGRVTSAFPRPAVNIINRPQTAVTHCLLSAAHFTDLGRMIARVKVACSGNRTQTLSSERQRPQLLGHTLFIHLLIYLYA